MNWRTASLVLVLVSGAATAQTAARIATYNIKYLDTGVGQQGDRLTKIREVIQRLEADIIGLQEINNRDALELVFAPAEWRLVIDDDSNENQDVALAVRRPWTLPDFPSDTDLDADDDDFLFPGSGNDTNFPKRRDVLAVRVRAPNEDIELVIMVVHAKSRLEGRALTDPRRVGAARDLIARIRQDYDEARLVLLGDFNDNPDDQSLNILETGLNNAPAGPEEIQGPFLVNLTETLVVADHVSHGLKTDAVHGDHVHTVDAGSRQRNNDLRGTNANTGDILFDQLLIPAWMVGEYVPDSAQVFDHAVAAQGNNTTRASDHVPVFADFLLRPDTSPGDELLGLRITALLPNPNGADDNHETVTLRNGTAGQLDIAGWRLVDEADNSFTFSGLIPATSTLTVTMDRSAILNNTGDTVRLVNPQGTLLQTVSYTAAEAQSGAIVIF